MYCLTPNLSHVFQELLSVYLFVFGNIEFVLTKARLQQYVNHELPNVQAGFRKGRGNRDQIANIRWITEKARVLEKHLFLLY